jgi:predicted regulator of Ras-like GTPase activity (Roadblock/LC7/MglB family)
MFGLFKKLFSQSANPRPTAAPLTEKPAPAPALASARTPMGSALPASNAASRTTTPPPSPAAASNPAPARNGDMIELPLNEIIARLPDVLAAQVLSSPGVMFALSANFAMQQLRTGAVRIPFGQLRLGSPPGTFANTATHDDSVVDLPLPLILAAIGPAGLARRRDQKLAAVPDDVTGVFGGKNGHFKHSAEQSSTPAPTPIPAPVTPKHPTPVQPRPAASNLSRPASVDLPGPSTTDLPKPATPALVPFPAAHKPTTSITSSPAKPKTSSPLPFATARPVPPPPAAVPLPTEETVKVAMDAVSGAWPEPVRQEIEQSKLGSAAIWIPVSRLEPGMKTCRVVFTWAELCGWIKPPVRPPVHGESQVELPLKIIAPLFLAKHRAATPRKIVSVDEEFPQLFSGRNRSAAPTPETKPTPAPALVVLPSPSELAAAPNVVGEILGQPSKKDWAPQEIIQRILSLPGVAGALLASNDGLLVAGQMPEPMKAVTMAAFLPRIFTHTGLCTGEVQLGTLRALRLSAGPALCVICKAGTLYLAVLGQPGQTLPEAAVEQLAVELALQNQ